MVNDEAIKYNALYQEVELAISNISNLGFDVSGFQETLKNIHNEVNNDVKVNYVKGMAEASHVQSYGKGIGALEKLKLKLDNFDVYASAYNTCSYIKMVIEGDIPQRELEKCVSKVIATLKNIGKSRTIDYDEEKHIVEEIYETAYNVIKLEIMKTGESQLYLFVKNEDTNISYFNNLIIKDVEKINLQDEKNKNIQTKMYELGQNGVYSNYLDLGLIKLILLSNGNFDIKKAINDNVKHICDEVEVNVEKINANANSINEKKSMVKEIKDGLTDKIKKAKKRLISSALTLTVLVTGAVGVGKLVKNAYENGGYSRKVEIVTSDGVEIKNKEDKVADGYHNAKVTAKVAEKVGDSYAYQEYDMSDLDFTDIKDYYNYAVKNYDVDLDNASLEVRKDSYVPHNDLFSTLFIAYGAYWMLILLFETLSIGKIKADEYSWFRYVNIRNVINDLKNIANDKKDLTEIDKELSDFYEAMRDFINKDERLKERFNTLYEENKYLLDDPDELYRRINNMADVESIKEAKRLIREK